MTRYDLILRKLSPEELEHLLHDARLSYLNTYTLLASECKSLHELMVLLASLRERGIEVIGVDMRDGVSLSDRLLHDWHED